MQIKDVRPESFVKQICCDCCGRLADVSEFEFQEFVSIDLKAGYTSIFGDGCDVQLDLCQHCLKASLGAWLRVSDADDRQRQLEDRLLQFDPDRHGGEFPTAADVSLQEPEDLPPQDRPSLTSPLEHRRRIAQMRRIKRYGMQLFFAPTTGSSRGSRQQHQRMARLERARQRRQAEFVRRGRAAIERSEAAGGRIPAEVVVAELGAKVDEARKRRSLGFLKGELEVPPGFDDDLPSDVLQDFEGSVTKGSQLTEIARTRSDPDFALALIDEAIELARNGDHELAKRILCDLVGTGAAGLLSNRELGQASDEQSTSPPPDAGASHRSEK